MKKNLRIVSAAAAALLAVGVGLGTHEEKSLLRENTTKSIRKNTIFI